MKQTPPNGTAEQHVREIRRQTRKKYSSEEKIRIVISGLRGEHSIAELCRRYARVGGACQRLGREESCQSLLFSVSVIRVSWPGSHVRPPRGRVPGWK